MTNIKGLIFSIVKIIWVLIPLCFVAFLINQQRLPEPELNFSSSTDYLELNKGVQPVCIKMDLGDKPVHKMMIRVRIWDFVRYEVPYSDEEYVVKDNGKDGDEVAGDGIYTFVLDVDTDKPRTFFCEYWVKATPGGFYFGDTIIKEDQIKVVDTPVRVAFDIQKELEEYGNTKEFRNAGYQERIEKVRNIVNDYGLLSPETYEFDATCETIHVYVDRDTEISIHVKNNMFVSVFSDTLARGIDYES